MKRRVGYFVTETGKVKYWGYWLYSTDCNYTITIEKNKLSEDWYNVAIDLLFTTTFVIDISQMKQWDTKKKKKRAAGSSFAALLDNK